MRKFFTRRGLPGKVALLSALLAGAAVAPAAAQTAYGLVANLNGTYSLATFQLATPGTFTSVAAITGIGTGQDIVGIDVRPATGQLFALGYNDGLTANNAQLYTLSTAGALTPVGGVLTLALGTDGGRVGFDFNPTVDRIRVTAGNRANYRLNPNNGAIAFTDGTLTYAASDANAGQTPGVGSSAYTNSYIGATGTTLYNLDEANNRLVTQNPPNDGTLNTVGPLGVTTNSQLQIADLDVYFNPTTGLNEAYMTTSAVNISTFSFTNTIYSVNLTTGAATNPRTIDSAGGSLGFGDLAIAIDRTVPATVTGQLAYALAGTNLIAFDTALPGTIRTSVGLTGVDATQTLVGLDVRPANNALYALGYNAAAATGVNNSQLYTINATTGVATPINAAFRLELGTGSVGFDFNPTVDRIRVVGANRNNYRLNPTAGAAPLAATDAPVSYTSGSNVPNIGAVAYTNSFTGASSTSGTTLYNYDETLNVLNTQNTAAGTATDGQLTTVGSSGIVVNTSAPTATNVDLDIYSTGVGVNTAYLVANTGTATTATATSLYTVNLNTGAATLVGRIGNGIAARDIAVAAATGVSLATRPAADLAGELSLYPNPLHDATSLTFTLARPAHAVVVVSDALGRTLATLDAGQLGTGLQAVRWAQGTQAAGLYYLTLRLDGQLAGTRTAVVE